MENVCCVMDYVPKVQWEWVESTDVSWYTLQSVLVVQWQRVILVLVYTIHQLHSCHWKPCSWYKSSHWVQVSPEFISYCVICVRTLSTFSTQFKKSREHCYKRTLKLAYYWVEHSCNTHFSSCPPEINHHTHYCIPHQLILQGTTWVDWEPCPNIIISPHWCGSLLPCAVTHTEADGLVTRDDKFPIRHSCGLLPPR